LKATNGEQNDQSDKYVASVSRNSEQIDDIYQDDEYQVLRATTPDSDIDSSMEAPLSVHQVSELEPKVKKEYINVSRFHKHTISKNGKQCTNGSIFLGIVFERENAEFKFFV